MRGVAERDNSNDPYENGGNPQRTDTGGGDYMHQAVEDEICYNNRFSPKAAANAKLSIPGGLGAGANKKKQDTSDWTTSIVGNMINR